MFGTENGGDVSSNMFNNIFQQNDDKSKKGSKGRNKPRKDYKSARKEKFARSSRNDSRNQGRRDGRSNQWRGGKNFHETEKELTIDELKKMKKPGSADDMWDVVGERCRGEWAIDSDPTTGSPYPSFMAALYNEFAKSSDGSVWIANFEKKGKPLAAPQPRTLRELLMDQMMPEGNFLTTDHWFYPELEKMWIVLCRRVDFTYEERVKQLKKASDIVRDLPHPEDDRAPEYKRDWKLIASHMITLPDEDKIKFMEDKERIGNNYFMEEEGSNTRNLNTEEGLRAKRVEDIERELLEKDWGDEAEGMDEDEFEALEQRYREEQMAEFEKYKGVKKEVEDTKSTFPTWDSAWYDDFTKPEVLEKLKAEAMKQLKEEEDEKRKQGIIQDEEESQRK